MARKHTRTSIQPPEESETVLTKILPKTSPTRVPEKRTVTWRAIFIGEKGRPTAAVEVDGQQYIKGQASLVNRITKERLEKLDNLQFEFQEV